MCAINRVASEPPSHRECAEFDAKACPFLTRPKMRRNEKDLPDERCDPAGQHIPRNPGVALIWVTKSYRPFDAGNGVLFEVGEPVETMWFAEGRGATRREVLDSITSGLPFLMDVAKKEGAGAVAELEKQTEDALRLVPEERTA
jgi:hypothetical protein